MAQTYFADDCDDLTRHQITYFNQLIALSLHIKPCTSVLYHVSYSITHNQSLDEDESCSTDKFLKNNRKPMSLLNICLKYLHCKIAHKIFFSEAQLVSVDFRPTLNCLSLLMIPDNLKRQLIQLYLTCKQHSFLVEPLQHKSWRVKRYSLHPEKNLYQTLNKSPLWKKEFNESIFDLSKLVQLILKTHVFDYSLENLPSLIAMVKSNCIVHKMIQYA